MSVDILSPEPKKVCAKCKALKFLRDFPVVRKNPDGRRGCCNACVAAVDRHRALSQPPFAEGKKEQRRISFTELEDAEVLAARLRMEKRKQKKKRKTAQQEFEEFLRERGKAYLLEGCKS